MRAWWKVLLLIAAAALLCGQSPEPSVTAAGPWERVGSNPGAYTFDVDTSGGDTVVLRSSRNGVTGFGALARTLEARPFRGQRLVLRAMVRTHGVGHWAGLWMMVYRTGREVIAFDDMSDRGPRGDTGFQPVSVVLPVRPFADRISFGVILSGGGEVEVKNLELRPASPEANTTDELLWERGTRATRESLPGNEWQRPENVMPWLF